MPTDTKLRDRSDLRGSVEDPLLSVVVPVYNEERNIQPFLDRIVPVLSRLGTYEIIFCLDPCIDQTERVIREAIERDPAIGLLVFSRRFGQPAAIMAGIFNSRGQWCVVIDVDLQDPPELIEKMLDRARDGYDAVTARRSSRQGETWLKRTVSILGYKVINSISDVPIPENTGDFRLISRRVIEELRGLSEGHGFLRGLVALVGYPQSEILYERDARLIGAGNYNRYLGSLKIGFNGIFGFSTFPLQIMMWSGFFIALLSAFVILIVVLLKIWFGSAYPMGIPTIMVLVLFIGGVQLAAIGVLGEYVGRIYDEVRQRPLFIVEKAVNMGVRDPRGPRSGQGGGGC
jgi:glycosyltransferase involved in cell wall biosynthesis